MILAPFKKLLQELRNHRLDIVVSHGNRNVASHYEVMAKMLERAISAAEANDSQAMAKTPTIPLDQTLTVPEALSNAFVTLCADGERYSIILKFNQNEDALAVHSFILGAGGKDHNRTAKVTENAGNGP